MDKKRDNIRFFDAWAKTYDSCIISIWLRSIHKDVIKFIANRNNLKILDVSCGTGEFLLLISKKLNKSDLYGVDISRKMIEISEAKLKGKARIKYSDVENLPFRDESFDYVITTEAFHHYPKQEKAMQEMRRVLKKDGRLIIADVNFFFGFFHRIFEFFEPGCVKINSRKEFYKMFKRHGFLNIRQKRSYVLGLITAGYK